MTLGSNPREEPGRDAGKGSPSHAWGVASLLPATAASRHSLHRFGLLVLETPIRPFRITRIPSPAPCDSPARATSLRFDSRLTEVPEDE